MKISLNWLKDYLPLNIENENIDEMAHKLAVLGFESDSVEHILNTYEKCIVGKVLTKEKHPDADKLSVCTVDTGTETLQIVCGAPNVDAGQTVPVALIGAKFGDFKIKKAKVRGIESCGMICAEDELGLSDDHSGIMILDDKLEAGTPLKEVFGYEDYILDLEVTSNRPDVLGYIGFAREMAILKDCNYTRPEIKSYSQSDEIKKHINIEIKDSSACYRYASKLIKNVKIKESPKWLKEKLLAVGLRPINNVVDITNFVMLETGHPMHAFDYKYIEDQKITVRKAESREKFTTLDEKEYELNDEILLICDGKKPVALAGVMGGLNSGVTEETTDVLLEVAAFNLADIRHTVKHLNIFTDSSKRFERGVDPNDTIQVIERAANLIEEMAEGHVVEGVFDCHPTLTEPVETGIRYSRCNRVLGFDIEPYLVKEYLEKLEFECKEKTDDLLEVKIPTFRPDIKSEIDLIEEVVRVHGYDKIPDKLRSDIYLEVNDNSEEIEIYNLRRELANLGLIETCGKSMVDGKHCEPFLKTPVKIMHPVNEEMNHLRNSLLISLLSLTSRNLKRKCEKINVFEAGKKFSLNDDNSITEDNGFAVVLCGEKDEQNWNKPTAKYDFYDIKGIAEEFLNSRAVTNFSFEQKDIPEYFDKNQSLSVYCNKNYIATFGKINDKVSELFEIEDNAYAFELTLDKLNLMKQFNSFRLKELSKYPKVVKDLSLEMDESMKAEDIFETIKRYGGKHLQKTELIDIYKGEQIEKGKKSYSFRMTFQSLNSTLKEKEIEKMFNKIINGITKDLDVHLR